MRKLLLLLCLVWFIACGTRSQKDEVAENRLCDSLHFDRAIVQELRQYTSAEIEAFHYSLARQIHEDGSETEVDPMHLQGLVFKETAGKRDELITRFHDNFLAKGYTLFTLEQNYGISGQPDVMAILKTTDKYDVLKQIKTDGINYNIDNDSLVQIIKRFDATYDLDLIGAGGDWCEFKIRREPSDWMKLANEAYAVCPDIIDQGAGSVEAAAEELKNTKRLFFWWD